VPPLLLIMTDAVGEPAALARRLSAHGIKSYAVRTVEAALEIASQWKFDGAIINCDGRWPQVLSSLSEFRCRVTEPIALLSAEESEASQMEALQTGATTVIVQPASDDLVAARIHRLLQMFFRAGQPDARSRVVKLGPLTIDPRRGAVTVGDDTLPFTRGELRALLLLAARPGEYFHRTAIANIVTHGQSRRGADMLICRIRKKLQHAGVSEVQIDTAYGRGYCIELGTVRSTSLPIANAPCASADSMRHD
jgi:DNA-binding response OmpR family regulator